MKIAILSPFYPFRGGIAQFSNRMYKELALHNKVKAYTFKVLYPGFLFPGKTQYVSDADPIEEINSKAVLNTINPISYISTARQINKFCPDVLIVPYWMSFLAPMLGTVCIFISKKIKIIALVHNAISHEKTLLEKPLAKYFFNRCDGFIAMSDMVKQDLLSLRTDATVLVTPHPIYDHYREKTDTFLARKKLRLNADKKTLLFFGFIRDYKGLDLLIESTRYLSEDYQLIIAGECYGDFTKYKELIKQSPIRNNIHVYEEYIDDDKASLLFSASDVLVLPYKSGTQSGVIAMAYQLETPVVTTDVGALGETVRKAGTGLVTEEISSHSIATTILSYFKEDNPEYYIANIRAEKERLSWSSFTVNLEKFLRTKVL